jgi:hypothetical protein
LTCGPQSNAMSTRGILIKPSSSIATSTTAAT